MPLNPADRRSTAPSPALAGWIARTHRARLLLAVCGGFTVLVLPAVVDAMLPGFPVPARDAIVVVACTLWLGATAVLLFGGRTGRPVQQETIALVSAKAARTAASPAPSPALTVLESPRPDSLEASASTPAAATDSQSSRMGPANRYKILRELGRGGMGVVYHALDTVLQREVALKELPLHLGGNGDLAGRFRQEARVLAKLAHPAIVQVHDLIEDDGRLWIALEYVPGGTVADAMRYAGGALPWTETVRIGAQVAAGLAFAHGQGVIHRDIKPMNVLLTDGRPPAAKLGDFGLARLTESTEHTVPGSLLGSARYMSPEQVAGRPADARSDLYSFGISLFEMLTGHVPFDGEFASVLARHANEAVPDVRTLAPEVPAALATLIASMVAKSPADRPVDADHVAYALRALAADSGLREAA